VIRIEAIWMSTEPLDMRAGFDKTLARVVQVFGTSHPHHAYLFANARSNRMKVLVHDGFGLWLTARRLNRGRFAWGDKTHGARTALSAEQLRALLIGLPWQGLGPGAGITTL
jgi:transposase